MSRNPFLWKAVFLLYIDVFCSRLFNVWKISAEDCPSLYPDDDNDNDSLLAGDAGFSDSHACQVDCYRGDEYDIICEMVSFNDLIYTVQNMTRTVPNVPLNIYIWSSPNIVELESGVFSAISTQMKSLHLLNLTNLINFPVLRDSHIKTLKIEGTPGVTQFNAELLPAGIEKIVLLGTGITQLSVDLQEVVPFQNMTTFVFVQHTLTGLSNNFLSIFPNLESMTFSDNVVSMTDTPDGLFTTKSLLKTFIATNNTFTSSSVQQQLFETIVENLNVANDSVVDLSNNNLQISKDAVYAFQSINTSKSLRFTGNQFGQFFSATGMLRGFDFLQNLDLSNTNVPKQKGLFRGLSVLRTLNLAGNRFRDLARIDIFEGLTAPLEKLDLSDNILMALPTNSFESLTPGLKELIISGNKFHSDLLDNPGGKYLDPIPSNFKFSNLVSLDLSRSGLKAFRGSWTSNCPVIKTLDISCNKFDQVTREFFEKLAPTLETLIMSFCAESKQTAPKVDPDSFSTLGNGTHTVLTTLILRSGYFKTWILKYLLQLPTATKRTLKMLDLSQNQIRYLPRNSFVGYQYLEKLHLGENFIQTIGPNAFDDLRSLKWLNLSGNHIVSIQPGEFYDLPHLTFLDLSNNGMVKFGLGALNRLTELTHLYLGRNSLASYLGMFSHGYGKKLIHLSLSRNDLISLNTYPTGCIKREDINSLDSLTYIYIDRHVTIFLDHGLSDTSTSTLLHNWKAKIDPNDPYNLDCPYGLPLGGGEDLYSSYENHEPGGFTEWTDDFLRLPISDPTDLTPRTFVALIPKCFGNSYKYIRNSTTNFICPIKDSRTYDPSAKQPGDSTN